MQSREEIRSNQIKWLRRFVIVGVAMLAVLYLLSGALRSYLSSVPLKKQMSEKLAENLPGWTIDFSSAGVGLSGAIPRLAFVVTDLQLSGPNQCLNYEVSSSDTRVHLAWGSLLQGVLQIAQVTADQVKVHLQDDLNCEKSTSPPPSSSFEGDPEAEEAQEEVSPDRQVNQVESEKPAKRIALLSEIRVGRAEVSYRKQKLVLTGLRTSAYYPDQPLEIAGEIRYELTGVQKLRYPKVRFNAELLGNKLSWASQGNWREGSMNFKGVVDGSEVRVEGDLSHIPLAPAVEILVHFDIWKKSMDYQSAWLSCRGEIVGDLSLRQFRAQMSDCGIEGEIGEAQFGGLRIEMDSQQKVSLLETIRIHLRKVHVDKVLDVLDIDVLGGVLADFGQVDALMRIEPSGEAELEGEISDLSFAFSNRSVSARQRVSSLKGRVFFDGKRVSGQLLDMDLFKGEFEGGLSFNFDRHLREGAMQVGVKRIVFDPTIQRLLVGEELSPMAFFGKAVVSDNRLAKWSGTLGADRVASQDIELKQLKVDYLYNANDLQLAVSSKEGEIETDSHLFEWLRPAFLEHHFADERQKWKGLKARLIVKEKSTLVWENSEVVLEPGIRLFSAGVRQPDDAIEGTVRVRLPKAQDTSWALRGSLSEPLLTPSIE